MVASPRVPLGLPAVCQVAQRPDGAHTRLTSSHRRHLTELIGTCRTYNLRHGKDKRFLWRLPSRLAGGATGSLALGGSRCCRKTRSPSPTSLYFTFTSVAQTPVALNPKKQSAAPVEGWKMEKGSIFRTIDRSGNVSYRLSPQRPSMTAPSAGSNRQGSSPRSLPPMAFVPALTEAANHVLLIPPRTLRRRCGQNLGLVRKFRRRLSRYPTGLSDPTVLMRLSLYQRI
jgi:hypothetical protein